MSTRRIRINNVGLTLDRMLRWTHAVLDLAESSMSTAERTSYLNINNKTKMQEILVGFQDGDTPQRNDGSSKVATRWEATVNGKSN